MNLRLARATIVLLFLAAQVAPGLHAAFESGHDVHACCTDAETAAHVDACDADHDAPPCHVCAASRASDTAVLESETPAFAAAEPISFPFVDELISDPFHVDTPDSRGPPEPSEGRLTLSERREAQVEG